MQNTPIFNQPLNVQEVADFLRVSKDTVYRLIREESLPAFKVGNRKYRIRHEDLENWQIQQVAV